MPHKRNLSKPSNEPAMRKSTRKVVKTAKSQQVEPELEEDELAATDNKDIYVNEEEERAFMRREEEEESEKDNDEEEIDKEQGDEEEEEEGSDNEEPEIIPVVPQKRKMGKDTNKSASRSFHAIYSPPIFSKSFSERVNRHESDEVEVMRKITYNLAIFSVAELAKPQACHEPVAQFLVLPSDLEWLDIHAHLKIKAGNVLFPGQAAIDDDAYEITFCIARHIPNPLPLSCVGDYKHLVENALRQQQPTVKIIIKAIACPQVQLQVCIYPPSN